MAEIVIDDPLFYETKNIDANGKVHIGKEYAGMRATIAVEEIFEPEDDLDDQIEVHHIHSQDAFSSFHEDIDKIIVPNEDLAEAIRRRGRKFGLRPDVEIEVEE